MAYSVTYYQIVTSGFTQNKNNELGNLSMSCADLWLPKGIAMKSLA